jgi:hypothetical protein
MYEHRHEPLLPRLAFFRRMLAHGGVAIALILISLGGGIVGYHGFEGFTWVDSFLNASMILGGMGPVNPVQTEGGKIFAGLYALYSGLILLIIAGILLAPIFHRLLHHFHLDMEENSRSENHPGKKTQPGARSIHD